MPELPEVQTIIDGLNSCLPDRRVVSSRILRESIVQGEPLRFRKAIRNRIIEGIHRRGKYIIFDLSGDLHIVAHLRMSGKFIVQPKHSRIRQHDRVIFYLDNHLKLIFSDVRCFGTLEAVTVLDTHRGLKQLGFDPWDRQLTADRLRLMLRRRSIAVKTALLDQSVIAGIGNIYASEILFAAGIAPTIPAGVLTRKQLSAIIHSMRYVLSQALIYNGASISDFRRIDEKQGMFQNFLKVYGKDGKQCIHCSSGIVKIIQNQRSTFLCPQCQHQ